MSLFSNKKLLKTGAKYSLISTISSIISMLIGIVMMLWLMPEEIGKWNAVSMFIAYLPFLQLGVQSGLSVELPIKIGENDDEKIRSYIANGYSFAIFISHSSIGNRDHMTTNICLVIVIYLMVKQL